MNFSVSCSSFLFALSASGTRDSVSAVYISFPGTSVVSVLSNRMASLSAVIAGSPRRLDFSPLTTNTGCVAAFPLWLNFPGNCPMQ